MATLNFHQKAKSPSLKKCLFDKIIEKFDITNSQQQVENYILFLSTNQIPILHMLISFDDFSATEKNLRQTLALDAKLFKSYIKILEELEMVQKIESESSTEPYWISKNKLFKIPGEISDPALALFHEQTLIEASENLQKVSKYNQFRSLYFSLSDEAFDDLYQSLQEIANRLKVTYCSNHIQDKRLFKFNFQLYPITDLVSG